MASQITDSSIRIDKWLWAARFFKTRALAATAVVGGKVKMAGERVKAAKAIRVGDELSIHIGTYEYRVRVRGLSGRRGPAPEAALLYEESAASKAAREQMALRLAAEKIVYPRGAGRPTRKARRQLIQFKQGGDR